MKLLLTALLILCTTYSDQEPPKEEQEVITICIDNGLDQDINDFLDLTETYPNATIRIHRKSVENKDAQEE